jgi:hypothetical protein
LALVLGKRGKLEESFLNGSIIIYMYGVLEHIIDEVWVGFYEIIEYL